MSAAPPRPQHSDADWARIAGTALLVICASGLLSNDLVVASDPRATADNLLAHDMWFRSGVLGELVMAGGDIVLAVALYRLLRSVQPGIALLGSVARLINAVLLTTGVVASLVALDAVTDTRFTASLSIEARLPIVQTSLDWHVTAMAVGLVFFGIGAAAHSLLLWRARFIPRALSGAYFAVSALLALSCSAMVVVPSIEIVVNPWMLAIDFLIELAVGLWLTFWGVRSRQLVVVTSAETPPCNCG